jgi:mannose PTS system EIIA component
MIGVLVVSHEPLGTALIRCTRHIYGRLPPQLAALDVIPDEDPEQACHAARELLLRINDGSGVIVFTDVYGATPSRIAKSLVKPHRVAVIAGVNLPVLVKALNNRRCELDEVVATLVESGRRAIFEVEPEAAETDRGATPQVLSDSAGGKSARR